MAVRRATLLRCIIFSGRMSELGQKHPFSSGRTMSGFICIATASGKPERGQSGRDKLSQNIRLRINFLETGAHQGPAER
jgi:hypothetical protein